MEQASKVSTSTATSGTIGAVLLRFALCLPLLLLASCNEPDAPPRVGPRPGSASVPEPRTPPPPLPSTPQVATLVSALRDSGIDAGSLRVWREEPEGLILAVTVPAAVAVDHWKAMRTRVDATGHYPLVVDDRQGVLQPGVASVVDPETGTSDVEPCGSGVGVALSRAGEMSGEMALARCFEALREDYGQDDEFSFDGYEGDWAEIEPARGFFVPTGIGDRPQELDLLLIPTKAPWEVAAWLRFGGWNTCPEDFEHVAVHELWHSQFGAEPVCARHDVLEFAVARPPANRDAALALARAQMGYCIDIVEQGAGTVQELAATLLNGETWYFWWD